MICWDDCSWGRRAGFREIRSANVLSESVWSRLRTFHISLDACWRIWRLDLPLVSSPRLVAVTNDKSIVYTSGMRYRSMPCHAGLDMGLSMLVLYDKPASFAC